MDVYLGSITMVAFAYAPEGYAQCAGQSLQVGQEQALFSLLGNHYGGDGINNFMLPDLRGRVPGGAGQQPGMSAFTLGVKTGAEAVALTTANLPSHSHQATPNNTIGMTGPASISFSTAGMGVNPNITTTATASQGTSNVGGAGLGLSSPPPNGTSTVKIYGPVGGAAVAIGGVSGAIQGTPKVTIPQRQVTSGATLANSQGGGTALNVMQPTLAVNYLIATTGLYPYFQ